MNALLNYNLFINSSSRFISKITPSHSHKKPWFLQHSAANCVILSKTLTDIWNQLSVFLHLILQSRPMLPEPNRSLNRSTPKTRTEPEPEKNRIKKPVTKNTLNIQIFEKQIHIHVHPCESSFPSTTLLSAQCLQIRQRLVCRYTTKSLDTMTKRRVQHKNLYLSEVYIYTGVVTEEFNNECHQHRGT
jgi:hypothetical protein